MGSVESKEQVTPARPLRNHHLSRVSDPRSPTTGIPRTPIEVGDSPRNTPQSVQEEEVQELPIISDPRSPTHGIARTPLRPPLHEALNLLVKQLNEVFVAEDSGIEESPPVSADPVTCTPEGSGEESKTAPPEDDKKEELEEEPVEMPTVSAEPAPAVVPPQRSRSKSPRSAGIKTGRQRPKKALLTSASGRSPLRILQEDNSPRMAVPNRQGKKLSFQSEPSSSLRAVKIPHSAWETSHNKENAQYGQSTS